MGERAYPLEPAPAEMRAMADAAVGFVTGFIEDLPDSAAVDLDGAHELAVSFRERPPEEPGRFDDLLDMVARGAAKAFNTTGPGYLAYIPGGGLYATALADFVACAINRYVGLSGVSPALAQLEWNVIRWLADEFGYPAGARGILTSGGSLSNFSAIVTARETHLGEDLSNAVWYASEEVHHSNPKAARLAGLPARAFRSIPCDRELRIDVAALRAAIREDRAAGRRPFLVIASAGTVNTGAVDPIAELVALARDERLWLHVDGAYGGAFQLTERGRALFRGVAEADSITLDPHKGFFLPYGTGCLLVRDGALLRAAHSVTGHYLQDIPRGEESVDFAELSPELSRDFRGLRVWLPFKLHGLRAFRESLDEKLDLARLFHDRLRDDGRFELPWEPQLSIVPFRIAGADDGTNRALLERINASKRVFMSSTVLGGRYTVRACVLSFRTHRDRIEEAIEICARAADDLTG